MMATAVAAVIPLDHSDSGYFLAVISVGSLLIATFLTLAEVAAPVATCSKVSWKSHSQRPGLQPSPPALPKTPQAMNSLYYIPSVSCTEL